LEKIEEIQVRCDLRNMCNILDCEHYKLHFCNEPDGYCVSLNDYVKCSNICEIRKLKLKKMKYKMEVGDKIYCVIPCVMTNGPDKGTYATTVGKCYTIIKKNHDKISIIDNRGQLHYFNVYDNWFINLREHRNKKLKKLNESRR